MLVKFLIQLRTRILRLQTPQSRTTGQWHKDDNNLTLLAIDQSVITFEAPGNTESCLLGRVLRVAPRFYALNIIVDQVALVHCFAHTLRLRACNATPSHVVLIVCYT